AGAEIVEAAGTGNATHGPDRPSAPSRAVLLARGREGYKSLCRVITERHLDPTFTIARSVREHAEGLTLLSEERAILTTLRGTLPVYAELVPGRGDRALRQWARAAPIPCVATNAVRFVHPEGHRIHQVLRAID